MCDWKELKGFDGKGEAGLDNPGVYRVRVRGKGIPRAAGVDCEGIIYIAMALQHLRDRIEAFETWVQNGKGSEFPHIKGCYQGRFPVEQLEVSWTVFEDAAASKARKKELLKEYEDVFCDLPPLNGRGFVDS